MNLCHLSAVAQVTGHWTTSPGLKGIREGMRGAFLIPFNPAQPACRLVLQGFCFFFLLMFILDLHIFKRNFFICNICITFYRLLVLLFFIILLIREDNNLLRNKNYNNNHKPMKSVRSIV